MVHSIASQQEFDSFIKEGTVFIDFWATWCGPCKGIAPVLEKLEPKYESIKFGKVELEELPDVFQKYDVTAMPTFIIFKNGKPEDLLKGADPNKVRALLEAHK